MKRIFSILFLTQISTFSISAQITLIKQWDYRFGGTDLEELRSFQQTSDGGYILGGRSYSGISGDKTQASFGLADYWIVKIDSLGIKQWDKSYGGNGTEALYSIQQTRDGGYILGGASSSDLNGDKTQKNRDSTLATFDYWVLKVDSFGNIQWDKTFGGSSNDILFSIKQAKDDGYILGGRSFSISSGDKTQNNWANNYDFWILKIDSIGTKQWDRRFGGTGIDLFASLDLTCDGGYILGGSSRSGISGDKTKNNRDTTLNSYDLWIVKINSNGIKQWDRIYGGKKSELLESLQQTYDSGFILGGTSGSEVDGDKSEPSRGFSDFWIVKTDSLGNKEWDKTFGGAQSEEEFGNITQTCDGGYLVPGVSYSDSSGDKSQDNLGQEQTWVVKVDLLGNKQWDKTLLTDILGDDESGFAIQNKSGDYLLANSTGGGIGGDKSQSCWGFTDFWISKFSDPTLLSCTSQPLCHPTSNSDAIIFIPEIIIYPNPSLSDLTISIKKQNLFQVSIYLYDVLGQELLRMVEYNLSNTYTKSFSLSALSKGVYFLDIMIDGERFVRKVLKE